MLKDARIVYLILYVNDLERSREFFEGILGFGVLEEDDHSVKYDAGHVILLLNRASDHGITLAPSHDTSTDIVFLVNDLERTRAEFEKRGITFTPTVRYVIGSITDFYDPDGHWFTLYQPSEEALRWPSGSKINAVLASRKKPAQHTDGPALEPMAAVKTEAGKGNGNGNGNGISLDGTELIYLFLFVRDAGATAEFYRERLGLTALEGGPCSQGTSSEEDGVVKYDGGGVMIATHHTDGTEFTDGTKPVEVDFSEHSCPPRKLDPVHTQGVAPVFCVPNISSAVDQLSNKGVSFLDGVARLPIGGVAKFCDPSGHLFFLYEPSTEALRRPSGAKIQRILADAV